VVRKDGAWKIDEDVYPLDSGKVYSMVKPKRDLLSGKVFMQVRAQTDDPDLSRPAGWRRK
jgi:hypothetical protein